MKVVVQRVREATVSIDNQMVSKINQGLLILLGIESTDNQEDIDWLVTKIANLRIFNDENHIMNYSLKNISGEVMVVSQFTLHASTKKRNRPSYIKAAKPEIAIPLYNNFIANLGKEIGIPVKTGKFGAMMDIFLINDGPVTIIIDTKNKE